MALHHATSSRDLLDSATLAPLIVSCFLPIGITCYNLHAPRRPWRLFASRRTSKFTRDQLLTYSYAPEAKQRAESLVTSFRQFIGAPKDEIEAISIFYSRRYYARRR